MPGCRRCAVQLVRCGFGSIIARGLQPRAAPHDRRYPREPRGVPAVAGREPPAAVARHASRPLAEDCVAAPAPADEDESDAGEPADEDSVAAPAPAPAPADDESEEYVWPAEAPRGAALIGRRIRIWWPHDRAWFSGSVNAFDGTKLYEVTYTDGSLWDEDLAERRWELLDERVSQGARAGVFTGRALEIGGKGKPQEFGGRRYISTFLRAHRHDGQTPWKQKSLRERTRLIIEPFLGAPVADAAGEESDDAPPPPRKRAALADAESSEEEERSAASATTWPQVGTWVRDAKAIRRPGDNPIGGTGAEGMVVCIQQRLANDSVRRRSRVARHPPSRARARRPACRPS